MLNINNEFYYSRIIFMGTSYFSVLSLEKLLKQKFNVVGVVSITDRFSVNNKNIFIESAVKKYSILQGIPILQSDDCKYYLFLNKLKKWHTKIIIIVAYRILPKIIWEIPPFGCWNLHPSLLPNYRGSTPINWVIINGESETGLSIFQVDKKIDMGKILLQKKINIHYNENAGSLSTRLSELGASLVINTLKNYIVLTPKEQFSKSKYKIAPKLLTINLKKFHWKSSIKYMHDVIRGLSPRTCALCILRINCLINKIKIYRIFYIYIKHYQNIGNVYIKKNIVKIYLKDGYIYFKIYNHKRDSLVW